MKISTPINRKSLSDHFSYNWWKYLVSVAVCIFTVNMYYVQTEYRPPEDKRIDIYIQGALSSQDDINAFFKPIWEKHAPDMETVETVVLMPGGSEDYVSSMQIVTYIAARQGDIYMLDSNSFKRYASQGAFIPLESYVEDGIIDTRSIDLRSGYVNYISEDIIDGETVTESHMHLYGIPMKELNRFYKELGIFNEDMYMSVMISNNNDENVIPFLSAIIEETLEPVSEINK